MFHKGGLAIDGDADEWIAFHTGAKAIASVQSLPT